MMRINQAATFDEVHQWISIYFNSTYMGTDEDNKGTIGGVNKYEDENYNDENYEEEFDENWEYNNVDKITIAFMKGKQKGQRKRQRQERRQWQRKRWKDNCDMLHLWETRCTQRQNTLNNYQDKKLINNKLLNNNRVPDINTGQSL
eukprot:3178206-Amphidinium_carterae.3